MSTKTLLRTMALLAAAGGAVALVLPFLGKSDQEERAAKRRRAPRRPAVAGTTRAKPVVAEKSPRGARTRRPGNGGPPSHH